LNSWTAIGAIFFGIGIFLSVLGLYLGYRASTAYDQIGFGQFVPQQVKDSLMWSAATPYLAISGAMFIVGFVGLIAGNSHKDSNAKINQSANTGYREVLPPPPQTTNCPSCGQQIIFVSEYQRWYCPNEKRYL
jgi:hypothetical protein